MGRPSVYTPEQDDIILSTTDSAVINQRFEELGFEPRSQNAIARRRAYLREQGFKAETTSHTQRRLPRLIAHKESLEAQLAKVNARRAALLDELRDVTADIQEVLEEVQHELAALSEDDGTA